MQTEEFVFEGHNCTIISPEIPLQGKPWIWRTEFLYAFNDADMALLEKGFHIAYCGYSDEYGSDRSVMLFKEFRNHIVKKYGLAQKASLFGFSRGALYAINYALKYPEDVSSLYLDAPVIDLRSWPAGLMNGCGSSGEWLDCKSRVLGLEDGDSTDNIPINPVHRLNELAEKDISVLMVAGDSDRYVPYEENGKLLADAFSESGREITVIIKKGCDHHPHSLTDVTPIVDFVMKNS